MRGFRAIAVLCAVTIATTSCWPGAALTGSPMSEYSLWPRDGLWEVPASPGDTIELSMVVVTNANHAVRPANISARWVVEGDGATLIDSVTSSSSGGISTNRLVVGDLPSVVRVKAELAADSWTRFTVRRRAPGGV